MTEKRAVLGLYALLALFGAAATGLAMFAAVAKTRWEPPGADALVEACRSFALPDATASSVLALVLGAGAFAVLALAARSALKQVRASRRFTAGLAVLGPVPFVSPRTLLFADDAPAAFCTGLLRPSVFVSTAAVERLGRDELEAVLAHERHHMRARDPLRLLIARTLSDALFFVPGIRDLADRYEALAELAADHAAIRSAGGDRRPLAAALLAFDAASNSAVVGIAPERVDHLLGKRSVLQLPFALLAVALVVLSAVSATALRVAEAAEHSTLNLPIFLASACMLAMAVGPLLAGAAALLGSGRLLRRQA